MNFYRKRKTEKTSQVVIQEEDTWQLGNKRANISFSGTFRPFNVFNGLQHLLNTKYDLCPEAQRVLSMEALYDIMVKHDGVEMNFDYLGAVMSTRLGKWGVSIPELPVQEVHAELLIAFILLFPREMFSGSHAIVHCSYQIGGEPQLFVYTPANGKEKGMLRFMPIMSHMPTSMPVGGFVPVDESFPIQIWKCTPQGI